MDYGFVRVAAAVPALKVADCIYNAENIANLILKAENLDIQFIVFPELSLTAYTCGDLFQQQALLDGVVGQLSIILEKTQGTGVIAIIGLPVIHENRLFDCAAVMQQGKILGVVPKSYIPGYKEYYEERWFSPGAETRPGSLPLCGQDVPFGVDLLFMATGDSKVCFGIEICEDLWVPIPPSSYQATGGAVILFNLSASNETIGKYDYRKELIKQQSGRCIAGYVYTSCGIHESTTDIVFSGYAAIAENGGILAETKRFSLDDQLIYTEIDIDKLINDRIKNTSFMEGETRKVYRKVEFKLKENSMEGFSRPVDPYPFVPSDIKTRDERCSEIFSIQTAGLAKRISYTGLKKVVIGISGGLDSTLALLVTAKTFDKLSIPRDSIIAVTMPGFGTTDTTYANAIGLMKSMNAGIREINIRDACLKHFIDIGHDPDNHDVTYENVQARERMQILMDIANQESGLVIGTSDLSELALGWSTYNGDHMSMYAVNCSIPKTLVKYLVGWAADNVADTGTRDLLHSILDTPITPELLPPDMSGYINQKTEDIIGPYELHDFFLYHTIRYGAPPMKILFLAGYAFKDRYPADELKKWLRVFYKRFFTQQFKRSCIPDGPKVGTISLSPRGDWRMPSDAEAALWFDGVSS